MSTQNVDLLRQGREALKGKWGLAIATFLVYMVIMGGMGVIPFLGSLGTLVLGGPFALGISIFSLNISRDREARVNNIFDGFQNASTAIGTYLLMVLYVFLWMLLLIVPGIIAAIGYSMTFYILADEPDLSPSEALRKSKEMMDGYKMKYFTLSLRFFGLALLCVLTLGIGFLWLAPYMQVTVAKFYDDLRGGAPEQDVDSHLVTE
ncbi:MAG: DUF975 family protein [Flavobacteriales bacterium]|nr:DUF975 family protein [Flavobacteriales bacterium]